MGYHTYFDGHFSIDRPLDEKTKDLIQKLHDSEDKYCCWEYTENTSPSLVAEPGKIDDYSEWVGYIVDKILAPNGYILSGLVFWIGEDDCDRGAMSVVDNKLDVMESNDWKEAFRSYHRERVESRGIV